MPKTNLASIALAKRPASELAIVAPALAPQKKELDAIEAYFFALPPDYQKLV